MKTEGWERRLAEFIETSSKKDFNYGIFDCALFACDAIKLLTGLNPRTIAREYQNENEANEIISEFGGIEELANFVADRYGFESIPVLFAQRGDIVMAEIITKSLGVCVGKKIAFPSLRGGLSFLDIDSKLLIKAWRI